MTKSLFNKYLNIYLFPFWFRLCPTVSGEQIDAADTVGINQTQIGRNISINMFYNNGLRICFHDSGKGK